MWNVPKRVLIISSSVDIMNGEKIPRAYVAPANDHSSITSGRTWARSYGSKEEYRQEYETDNNGFKCELYNAAANSSQGGKLSFWMCKVSKDGKSWLVGITSEYLLSLLKQSTCTNGLITRDLMFARNSGKTGLLHSDMIEYKEAIADAEQKSRKKTTKCVIGRNYVSPSGSVNDLYLCDIYVYETRDGRLFPDSKMKKCHVLIDLNYYRDEIVGCKTISEFILRIRDKLLSANSTSMLYNMKHLFDNVVDKIPARVEGNIALENDLDPEMIQGLLNQCREAGLNEIINDMSDTGRMRYGYITPRRLYPEYLSGLTMIPEDKPDIDGYLDIIDKLQDENNKGRDKKYGFLLG